MEQDNNNFNMVAKTLFGLEEVLAKEIKQLGGKDVKVLNRAVSFKGDKRLMYKANLCLRTAISILKPIHEFITRNEHTLYDQVKAIDWTKWLDLDKTFSIESTVQSEYFNHTKYVALKAKDAIVDQFKEKFGERPSVDREKPYLKLHIHISQQECTILHDSSGYPLFKRGYRTQTNKAPLNEVLAAGLILLSGWDGKTTFIDPMCGSGTIPIEAGLIAGNIPPNIHRKYFGFQLWDDFDENLWEEVIAEAKAGEKEIHCKILASDVSDDTMDMAGTNIEAAGLDEVIRLSKKSFFERDAPPAPGLLIVNPPYGERIVPERIMAFYKKMGDRLKENYSGYDAWIITSNADAVKKIGLRHSKRLTLYNGSLECRFLKYEMYRGTKKSFSKKERRPH
ncbi:THUMP domain-containing class I SAM-dependent RNA methyltransferase [Flexithrix dorotheae]|uniref:THUMP domain-containing class I SAM-dependent RNA methyltransferase n=1 Tax=Flexithrix dorotheae TaxID=70993 RepID=UPI00037C7F49|nr:THUMP domain-containing protein [Flexithrix dorotheae]